MRLAIRLLTASGIAIDARVAAAFLAELPDAPPDAPAFSGVALGVAFAAAFEADLGAFFGSAPVSGFLPASVDASDFFRRFFGSNGKALRVEASELEESELGGVEDAIKKTCPNRKGAATPSGPANRFAKS
jgi:hypothetical protein